MRFPSVAALAERAKAVLLRFPWPLLAGALAAVSAVIGVDGGDEKFWARLCFTAMLAIPLTTALTLLAEREGWNPLARAGSMLLIGLGLAWFFHTWPGPEEKHLVIRYLQLSASFHLLVAFLPFVKQPEDASFWEYNRRLFEGFLRAVLFSGVLYVGLAIALGALDKLFGVDIEGETYLRLWFIIAFVVNTWIFLAAVPEQLGTVDKDARYPRALKVFTQYILTPLVAVYLVLLTAYLVKILVTGSWPSGWIGYLVSSVATAGILGFLLVHPLRAGAAEGWIRTYSRLLFIGLMPAAAMFLLALWKRIGPYGLTELRFLGLLLGGWLLGIAALYTVRRDSGIRIIPVSLTVILLLTAFGPLGTTAVSVRSQANRVRGILAAHNISETTPAGTISEDDTRQVGEGVRFLLERNAPERVVELFGPAAAPPLNFDPHRADLVDSAATQALKVVGLVYRPQYYYDPSEHFALEPHGDREAIPIQGFEYLVVLAGNDTSRAIVGDDTLRISLDSARSVLRLYRGADPLLGFDFRPLLDSVLGLPLPSRDSVTPLLTASGGGYRGMLLFKWLSGERKDSVAKVQAWRGDLYLGRE